MYALEPEFRARLGLAEGAGLGPLAPAQGVEDCGWGTRGEEAPRRRSAFHHPDEAAVSCPRFCSLTGSALRRQRTVLCLQDGTDLDYTSRSV